MEATPQIKTSRLLLRAVTIEDAADIFAYAQNPNVLRYTTGTTPGEFAATAAFVRGLTGKPDGAFAWAIRLQSGAKVIGVVEFGMRQEGTGSVDYALSEPYWNRGIMTEAVRAVLDWAYRNHPTLRTVSSSAMTANPASTRMQQECGMGMVGLEYENWVKFDHPIELAVCAIPRAEWEAANHGGANRRQPGQE